MSEKTENDTLYRLNWTTSYSGVSFRLSCVNRVLYGVCTLSLVGSSVPTDLRDVDWRRYTYAERLGSEPTRLGPSVGRLGLVFVYK